MNKIAIFSCSATGDTVGVAGINSGLYNLRHISRHPGGYNVGRLDRVVRGDHSDDIIRRLPHDIILRQDFCALV